MYLVSYYCTGILAPILAEVMYDKGGPVVPLLVFGPLMIIAAIAAGESRPPVATLNDVQSMMGMGVRDENVDSCLMSGESQQ